MHLEDKLTFLQGCLEEKSPKLIGKIPGDCDISGNDVLKTCYYHMKSLDESIQQDSFKILIKKNKEELQLPKIANKQSSTVNSAIYSFSKTSNKIAHERLKLSQSDLELLGQLKSSSKMSRLSYQQQLKQNILKSKGIPKPRLHKIQRRIVGLSKEQRYYENLPVQPSLKHIQALGIYQASNLYKTKNLTELISKLTIVAEKPIFNPIKMANKHELFLTNVQASSFDFCVEQFIQNELNKERQCEKVIKECNEIKASKDLLCHDAQQTYQSSIQQQETTSSKVYITMKDYQFVSDQNLLNFKTNNLENWGQIIQTFSNISKCLKSHKISFFKIKSEKINIWSGKKTSFRQLNKILGLQFHEKPAQKITMLIVAFKDRLKVRKLKNSITRKQSLARWVCQRLKIFTNLRQQKRLKIERANALHKQLLLSMQWEVEVYLPSLSVNQFKRNTTQYMESIENLYHTIWKRTDKSLIIILPTLNENLLKLLQTKIKITRNITIICPEIHQTFPTHLSLASQVLFSYETLKKIKNAINNKKAVLVPGQYQNLEKELLISDYLSIPLMCSLNVKNNHSDQKEFFRNMKLKNTVFCVVNPCSSFSDIILKFTQVLVNNPQQKKWIMKLNGEFKGRGFSTIQLNPSKYLRQSTSGEQSQKILENYLRTNFKLKLKVNFENSLFTVEQFLQLFQRQGGIIEEEIIENSTYEICFKKHTVCEYQYLYKVFGIDFCSKAWLSFEPDAQISDIIARMQEQLETGQYFGYVVVTICKGPDSQYYGIDIKLCQTYSSSAISFIRMVEDKRSLEQESAHTITHLPTKRRDTKGYQDQSENLQLTFQSYHYLIIPNLVFTDVGEEQKARLIEELMHGCWADRHLKLHEESRVFLSLGIDFSLLLSGRDVKQLKKRAIETLRELAERTSSLRSYRGKEVTRDVFQYGDIIRSISQIRLEE